MGQKRTKAIILKGRGDSLAYWKPLRSGRRAFRFDGMFTSGEATRVEACGGHGCGWLFPNRSGRRRWCLMSVCGNRAKVRAFAARQH